MASKDSTIATMKKTSQPQGEIKPLIGKISVQTNKIKDATMQNKDK